MVANSVFAKKYNFLQLKRLPRILKTALTSANYTIACSLPKLLLSLAPVTTVLTVKNYTFQQKRNSRPLLERGQILGKWTHTEIKFRGTSRTSAAATVSLTPNIHRRTPKHYRRCIFGVRKTAGATLVLDVPRNLISVRVHFSNMCPRSNSGREFRFLLKSMIFYS